MYVEPFGGGASVLLRKAPAYAEVYNDLDDELVNLFRVLRDVEGSARLTELLRLTPYSRREFIEAYKESADPIERARRSVIRSFMGFGSASFVCQHRTGFRANSQRSGTTAAHDWGNYPGLMHALTERLRGVTIECKPAIEVIVQQDHEQTLHYVDPPYPHKTRSFKYRRTGQVYRHEMSDDDHRALAQVLRGVKGMVVVSGYPCDLYDRELFPDWMRVTTGTHADGALERTEVLWMNRAAERAEVQGRMFAEERSA